jgi:hypothetical protein
MPTRMATTSTQTIPLTSIGLSGRTSRHFCPAGEGIDHTTAADNVSALIETVAPLPGQRILNAADPDSPSAVEIARIVARHLDHGWDEVLLDGEIDPLEKHPWNTVSPIRLDMSAARALGYQPVGTYAQTVGPALDFLVDAARTGGERRWKDFDGWFAPSLFDYRAEDEYLTRRHPLANPTGEGAST